MHNKSLVINSSVALIFAILAWCAAGYFFYVVMQMQAERAAYAADAATVNLEEGQAAQLHAVARQTVADRATLDATANVDLLSAVNLIESVSASGTPVHVISAQTVRAALKNSPQQINVVDLIAQAQGNFASVVRVMRMLETLPLTTTVQEVDLTRPSVDLDSKYKPETWTLNVHLRFYTTATLST